jgi:glycosyltransferase involved in cell wall biosynthesis
LLAAPPKPRTTKRPAPRVRSRRAASKLRIGIVTPCLGVWDADGRLRAQHVESRLTNALLERFPDSRVCIPICPDKTALCKDLIDVAPENVEALPAMSSTIKAQKYFFQARRAIRRFAETVDVLYVKLPHTLPRALKGINKPKLVHVIGDAREVVRVSTDYRGVMRLLAKAQALDMERVSRQLVAEPATRVATHGRELWNKLGCRDGRSVVSSCLYEHEMQPDRNRRMGDVPRLLFVGFLRPEKGVQHLLQAFHQIRATRRVKLTLVGGADRETGAAEEIRQLIDASPYRADIEMAGMLPFGKPLFDAYRQHDLYVLPTLSEGTPRTLIEARGFGCPVVATRVGGIPESVTDGRDGLLVEPANPLQLAAAIERVLNDEPLRERLIANGLQTAKSHSLDRFADELAEELDILGERFVAPARRAVPATLPRFEFPPRFGMAVNS